MKIRELYIIIEKTQPNNDEYQCYCYVDREAAEIDCNGLNETNKSSKSHYIVRRYVAAEME